MRQLKTIAAGLLMTLCLQAAAQNDKPVFEYDLAPRIRFINYEYDGSDLDYSRTLFGVRLRATAGIGIDNGKTRHKIQAGADPLYSFGGGWKIQPLIYYQFSTPLRHSRFNIIAGMFPRSESKAWYSMAFFSDANHFLDSSYEGIQFSWQLRHSYFELGVDWQGELRPSAPAVREEFSVYSGGEWRTLMNILKLGYAARMHHYACNAEGSAANVVDDILVNPYIEANFGPSVKMQKLAVRLGYLQSFQRDRAVDDRLLTPAKGEFTAVVRHFNVILTNELFFGADLMPYYDSPAPEGGRYGSSLYMGDPFMRNAGGAKFGVMDRITLAWEPRLAKNLTLSILARAYFNGGFAGHQEQIGIKYTLGK